jgi:Domain of unknown function (DUF4398)
MITGLLLSLLLLPPTQTEVTVVPFPAKGKTSLSVGVKGKAEVERTGTVTRAVLQLEGLQAPQAARGGMNAYVVWAVSPEGIFDNLGELELSGAKGTLQATTLFDRFALLVTLEPHYMVDKPSANIAYKNDRPRELTGVPLMIEIGAYDYPMLQSSAAGTPPLVEEARAAMEIANAVQAPQRAEVEFRNARVAIDTMEELFRRNSAPDVVSAAAHAAIRHAQLATVVARQRSR